MARAQLSITVDLDLARRLLQRADATRSTVSAVVATAVERLLEEYSEGTATGASVDAVDPPVGSGEGQR